MSLSFAFFPDEARGRWLDRRMRQQLVQSLEHIQEGLNQPPAQTVSGLPALIGKLQEGGLASPSTFGLYYEAAEALLREQTAQGLQMLEALCQEPLLDDRSVRIRALAQVVPPERRQRYQRLMDTDPNTPFRIVSPKPETAAAGIDAFTQALARLQAVVPDLAGEFEALVREVILVTGAPDLGYDFAGGSCYMLWGALFINPECHENDIALMAAMAHEGAHSLLFGFTMDEPLVLNDEQALFVSPLRDDPRPMDGIYHATFVTARMHWTMSRLLASGTLSAAESAQVESYRAIQAQAFWGGHQTVQASAQLSATGQALMDAALAYMTPFATQR